MHSTDMQIRRNKNRGTASEESDVGKQNWAGDAYRKLQQSNLESVKKNITVHLGRGIRTSKLEDIPKPRPRVSTEGMTRVTERGTSSRKSKNSGMVPA